VARLVAQVMSNPAGGLGAVRFGGTVQFHLTRIYAKLGVSSRTELAAQFRDSEYSHDQIGAAKSGEASGNQDGGD
jgi:hypothetical protein